MDIFSSLKEAVGTSTEVVYQVWYANLDKPFFAPPPWFFGVAWGLIYPLIAYAFFYTLYKWHQSAHASLARKKLMDFLLLFALNIALNLTFTSTLIISKNNLLISLHITLVLITLAVLQYIAWKKYKLVFWLLIPYILWGSFATILQYTLTVMN